VDGPNSPFDRKQGAALSFKGLQPRIEKILDVSTVCEVEKLESSLLVLDRVSLAASRKPRLQSSRLAMRNEFSLFCCVKLISTPFKTGVFPRRDIETALEILDMGMSGIAVRTSGRGRRGVPHYRTMAEINMTPFIDVILVLLSIFMVAAPLLATGVAIDLPRTKAVALSVEQKLVSVAVDDKGSVSVMDQPVQVAELADKLKEVATTGIDERIYVRGANQVNYGRIGEVMSIITAAGYKKVALVTDPYKN
jgi:biopolymer transport protein TolR